MWKKLCWLPIDSQLVSLQGVQDCALPQFSSQQTQFSWTTKTEHINKSVWPCTSGWQCISPRGSSRWQSCRWWPRSTCWQSFRTFPRRCWAACIKCVQTVRKKKIGHVNPFHPDCKTIFSFIILAILNFAFRFLWSELSRLHNIHNLFYIKNHQNSTLKAKKYIHLFIKTIILGPKNGTVGWKS